MRSKKLGGVSYLAMGHSLRYGCAVPPPSEREASISLLIEEAGAFIDIAAV